MLMRDHHVIGDFQWNSSNVQHTIKVLEWPIYADFSSKLNQMHGLRERALSVYT